MKVRQQIGREYSFNRIHAHAHVTHSDIAIVNCLALALRMWFILSPSYLAATICCVYMY